MKRHSAPSRRRLAAGAMALAGAALLGWAVLQPPKEAEVPGWEPVNERVMDALSPAEELASGSPNPASSVAPKAEPASVEQGEPSPTAAASSAPPTAVSGLEASSTNMATAVEVDSGSGLLNLNTATAEQLDELKGIGPSKAQSILEYRKEHGVFRSVEELLEVNGIGAKLFAGIRDQVTV